MEKLKVFISSAMDELEAERDIAIETITNLGMGPKTFEDHAGVEDPFTESLKLVQDSDIVIVMLWKRYSKVVEEEYKYAISQNKPVLVIEKELNVKEEREEAIANLLNQIKNRHTYKKFRKPRELRETLIKVLQQVLFNAFSNTIIKLSKDEIYTQIRNTLDSAKDICMLSRTPILLFGPRPYLSEYKLPDEKHGYEITSKLWKAATKGERKYTLIISSHSVVKEIEKGPHSIKLAKVVLKNLEDLCKEETETSIIACTSIHSDSPPYLTFVIADNTVIIWIKSLETNHGIKSKNDYLAFAFRHTADEYIKIDNENNYKDVLVRKLRDIIKE